MTMNGPAYEALSNAKAKYEADGYAVSVKERLPKPFDAFTADAVARRDVIGWGELAVVVSNRRCLGAAVTCQRRRSAPLCVRLQQRNHQPRTSPRDVGMS